MNLYDLPVHPAAKLFPLIEGDEFAALASDIQKHGLQHPIVLVRDKEHGVCVLDGRNRLRACKKAGVTPTHEWYGKDDPVGYVVSTNIARRHLTPSQLARLGADVEELYAKEAAQKQRQEGAKQAKRGKEGGRGKKKTPSGQLAQRGLSETDRAREKAAKQTGASGRSIQRAKKVKEKGSAKLNRAVLEGKVTVDDAVKVLELPPKTQDELLLDLKTFGGQRRTLKEARFRYEREQVTEKIQSEPKPPPEGPFRVIVIDPPWKYDNRTEDVTHRSKAEYPTMSVEQIQALPVKKLADGRGCVLWLWTTNMFMPEAFRLIRGWGFEHKTILTWDKEAIGAGNWLRNVTEHCILAVKGDRPVVRGEKHSTLIREKRREHSRKPEAFYALVEEACPGAKLEMFAREPRKGWELWGAETDKFDTGKSEKSKNGSNGVAAHAP
jgi:N6-adenosine-specific RNA methylase IME4